MHCDMTVKVKGPDCFIACMTGLKTVPKFCTIILAHSLALALIVMTDAYRQAVLQPTRKIGSAQEHRSRRTGLISLFVSNVLTSTS